MTNVEEYKTIEALAVEVKVKLDSHANKNKIVAVYAFNSTGKTRLANILTDSEDESSGGDIKTLCYSAFLEDVFIWDNDNYVLTFDKNLWIIKLVEEQGLEGEIIKNFTELLNTKIEPAFNISNGEVIFSLASGDDTSVSNIKISRAEESMFVWSIFLTVLKSAVDALNTKETDRTTQIFNNLEYIIIDDPVSSIDDSKIITMAINLIETIDSCNSETLKFLVTTHHALFYNVLVNNYKRVDYFESHSLSKNYQAYRLSKQDDSPFSYHLSVKVLIENAIHANSIEKYHFNLFRNLLEKTSNFLGYNHWSDCISTDNKKEFIRLLNLYSHSKLSDLESKELPINDKDLFQAAFQTFVNEFNWK